MEFLMRAHNQPLLVFQILELELLDRLQRDVLWLVVRQVQHALREHCDLK